jgi:hypothetical protein
VRKVAAVSLLTITLFLLGVAPSYAWHHGRVFIGVGPVWWGPPYWYYPPPYYGYSPPPVVVEQQPQVYIQQEPSAPPPPPSAAQAPAPESLWYYCASAKGYYPSVPTCPEAWIKVPSRP